MSTINDIARLVNKSAATVSRALNDHPRISQATKDKVRAAARELGYRPSMVARSLRKGKTMTVGLGISDLMNPFHVEFARRVEELLSQSGYQLLIMEHLVDEKRVKRSVEVMLREGCDGVILNCGPFHPDDVQEFLDGGVAVFAYGMPSAIERMPVDGLNPDYQTFTEAFRHLAELGHRRIKYIYSILEFEGGQNILAQVLAHMKEAGIEGPLWMPVVECSTGNQLADGYTSARMILQEAPETTANFCTNEYNAVGVCRALREQGVHVPEDMSLVAVDNTWIGENWEVPLSTIDLNVQQCANVAVETLIRRIENKNAHDPQHLIVPTRFIARASTGPVRKKPLLSNDT